MNPLGKSIKPSFNFQSIPMVLRFLRTAGKESVTIEEVPKTKLLKVAIIGMPNAGKSTLINSLMDRKVCPVSSKVHTTKRKSIAIFTQDDTQVVFLDTPGVVSLKEWKKFDLNRSFVRDGINSMYQANLIGVVHDVSNPWTRDRLDIKLLHMLEELKKKPSFLVLNKIDMVKQKRKLLELTHKLTENRLEGKLSEDNLEAEEDEVDVIKGWPFFKEIFMLSSLEGNGIDDLKKYLIKQAKPAQWLYPADKFTNEKYEDIIVSTVRAKLLDFLPQEVPYLLQPMMEFFEVNENGKITCVVLVKCPSNRVAKLVAGGSDGRLNRITAACQDELQNTFRNFVKLQIVLKGKEKKE
ncbi:GTPase Era, mitochondrial [Coccinella septempunctata]|uniref:GTPase Era, mitochondrial n=1 Tax=Coccinella septempunctata TaxID=41139 RepID=UPI001D08A0EC|nr:GTPase Era, mitochondrial [Coccinella septempunctata]